MQSLVESMLALLQKLARFHHFKNSSGVLDVGEWIRIENDEVREFAFLQCAGVILKTHDCSSVLRCGNDNVHRTQTCCRHQFHLVMKRGAVQSSDIAGVSS